MMERYNLIIQDGEKNWTEKYYKWNDVSIRMQQLLNDKTMTLEIDDLDLNVWDIVLEDFVDIYFVETLTN